MLLARALSADRREDLDLGFDRMALPSAAREYLFEKIRHSQILFTGLLRENGRFLRALAEDSEAPREEYPHFVSGDQKLRPGSALLSGRADQFDRLLARARKEPGQQPFAAALARVFDPPLRLYKVGARSFDLRERPLVMGVVNVTPDSFSDAGKYFDRALAIDHGTQLAKAGADILDVGGESTRPGSAGVSAEEELSRVIPVIEALSAQTTAVISVDTTKAIVARAALKAGATLVNDVSGFHADPELARVTAEAGASCCVMHLRGTPATMQQDPQYGDVVEEVLEYLAESVAIAEAAGISRDRILVDPGIGFGKTVGQNLMLLRRLGDLRALGCGVLVGTSRKAFIGHVLGGRPPSERLFGTLSSIATVVGDGAADVVRVHDVSQATDAIALATAVRKAKEGGTLYARPVAGPDQRG